MSNLTHEISSTSIHWFMEVWYQLHNLISKKPLNYIPPRSISPIVTHKTIDQRILPIVVVLGSLSVLYYIFSPSFYRPDPSNMFTKRPDKYTTGLINLRNDCFANSSIQAYLSLPGLTEYLNKFIVAFKDFEDFLTANDIDKNIVDETTNTSEGGPDDGDEVSAAASGAGSGSGSGGSSANINPKFKKMEKEFSIPLHISLARIIKKLQSTQMTSRTISVWTFLHDLEKIFNAKISRSQHDAQELTQLINETLEHENLKIISKFKRLLNNFQHANDVKRYNILKSIEIPEFPLNGLILNQMKCLNCKGVSKPNFSPFLMLTLHTPETISTNLESLLDENESESIDDYQCLKCRIKVIINNENYLKTEKPHVVEKYNLVETKILEQLQELNNDAKFCINDDLSQDLEDYIKNYNKNNVDITKVTSTVLRKNHILKPPKIFGIHLSRSSFNGVNVVRNSCSVSFKDHLNLSIGKEYYDELKNFQSLAQEDEFTLSKTVTESKVLTNDVNDMEDEDVQDESLEEKGEIEQIEDIDEEDDVPDDDDDDLDSDDSSVVSIDTLKPQSTSLISRNSGNRTPDTLNNAPITVDQSDDLLHHFKQFKFNENNKYKYRLKAMIRHQGSHTQGHYECYKRKPLYVKNKEGMIIKLSPEIADEVIDDGDASDHEKRTSYRRSSGNSTSSSEAVTSSEGEKSRTLSNSSDRSDIISSLNEENIPEPPGSFRRKFSNMMGRRPSVFQADPDVVKVQEIMADGLNTPAELLVKEVDADYFSNELSQELHDKLTKDILTQTFKLKKIPSLLKHPYWRISDSIISEVTKASVLVETTSVYMLYYERVEK